MSDVSSLVNVKTKLPSDLSYVIPASAPRARSFRCTNLSQNRTTYSAGDTISISLSARKNCFMDCSQTLFQFTVKNNAAYGDSAYDMKTDNFAASFISRFEVFHGSSSLEQINSFGGLYSVLGDIQMNPSIRSGLGNTMGCSEFREGVLIPAGCSRTFAFGIPSGVCGSLAQKFLNLNIADDISVLFTLADAAQGAVWGATVGSYSIIAPQLITQVLELSESGMAMLNSVTPLDREIFIPTASYRHYSSTVTNVSGELTSMIPCRFASLKSLFVAPMPYETSSSGIAYSNSSRVNPNFSSYSFKIGSMDVPQRPIRLSGNGIAGYAESYCEMLKGVHSLGSMAQPGVMRLTEYNRCETANVLTGILEKAEGGLSHSNGFLICQDFESISGRSSGSLLSGMNTLSSNLFLVANIDTVFSTTYTINSWAFFDMILILTETGLYQTRF